LVGFGVVKLKITRPVADRPHLEARTGCRTAEGLDPNQFGQNRRTNIQIDDTQRDLR